jgi:adenylate cyclase
MGAPARTTETDRQALLDLATLALLEGERRYTALEVCALADCDHDTADGLWRAMGFPDMPDDEVAFTDGDVAALRAALALQADGVLDEQTVRAQTRVMSQALATIAAAHMEITEAAQRDVDRFAGFVVDVLPALDDLLVYLYRRHLLAAVENAVLLDREDPEHLLSMAVGFADLVGFTKMANHLEERELSELIEVFTQAAADVVAEEAGRVVKMIGDEVMFASPDPVIAANTALRLVAEVGDHHGLPPLRAGVAAGPVVLRQGDVFGRPVNLAHRLVDVARSGNVLVDTTVATALADQESIETQRVHSIRRLRGFDRLRVFVVRPREDGPDDREDRDDPDEDAP